MQATIIRDTFIPCSSMRQGTSYFIVFSVVLKEEDKLMKSDYITGSVIINPCKMDNFSSECETNPQRIEA